MTAGTKSSSCKSLPAALEKKRHPNKSRNAILKKLEAGWDTRIERGLQDYDTLVGERRRYSRRHHSRQHLTDLVGSDSTQMLQQSRPRLKTKADLVLDNGLRRREPGTVFPAPTRPVWQGLTNPSSLNASLPVNGEETITIRSFDRCLGAVKYRDTDSLHELRRAIVSAKLVCDFAFAYADGIRIERKLEPNIRARTLGPHLFIIIEEHPVQHHNLDDLPQECLPCTVHDTNEPSTRFPEVSFRDALEATRNITIRRIQVIAAAATTVIQCAIRRRLAIRRLAVQRMLRAKERAPFDTSQQHVGISVLQERISTASDHPGHPAAVDSALPPTQELAVIQSGGGENKSDDEVAAVMRIQCLARSRSSRRKVSTLRQTEKAAIKIQATARGRVARRCLKGPQPLHSVGTDETELSPKSCTVLAASQAYQVAKTHTVRVFISNVLAEVITRAVAAAATKSDQNVPLNDSHSISDTTTAVPQYSMQNLDRPQSTPLSHLRKASPQLEAIPSHHSPLSFKSEVKEAEPPALVSIRQIAFESENAKADLCTNMNRQLFRGEQSKTPAPSSNETSPDNGRRSRRHLYETDLQTPLKYTVEDIGAHVKSRGAESSSTCTAELETNPKNLVSHLQPCSAPASWHSPETTAAVAAPPPQVSPIEASNIAPAKLEFSSAPDQSLTLDARSGAPADASKSIEIGAPILIEDSSRQLRKTPIKASTRVSDNPLMRVVEVLGLHVRSGQYLMCSFSRSNSNMVLVLAFDPNADRVHRGALEVVDVPEDDDSAFQDVCHALAQRLRLNVHGDVELCEERALHSGKRHITVIGIACAKDRESCKDWVCSIWLEGETTLRIVACEPCAINQARSYHGVVRLADWAPLAGEVKGGLKSFRQKHAQEFCQLLATHIEVHKETGSVSLGSFRYLRSCGVRAKVDGSTTTKYVVCSFWRTSSGLQARVFDPSCGHSSMVNFHLRDLSALGYESKLPWDEERVTTEMCYDVARRIAIDEAGKANFNALGSGRHCETEDSDTFLLSPAQGSSRDYLGEETMAGSHVNNSPLQDCNDVALSTNTATSDSIATLGAAFAPEPYLVCSFWRLGDRIYVRGFHPSVNSSFFGDFDVCLAPLQDPDCCRKLAAKLSIAPDCSTLELAVDRVTVGAKAADGCVMLFSFASPHLVEAVNLETLRRYRLCLDRDVPISDREACQALASRLAVVDGKLVETPSNFRRLPQDMEFEEFRVFDAGDGQLEFITSDNLSLVVSPEQWHWTGHGALLSTDPQKLSEAIASRIVRADDHLILLPPEPGALVLDDSLHDTQ